MDPQSYTIQIRKKEIHAGHGGFRQIRVGPIVGRPKLQPILLLIIANFSKFPLQFTTQILNFSQYYPSPSQLLSLSGHSRTYPSPPRSPSPSILFAQPSHTTTTCFYFPIPLPCFLFLLTFSHSPSFPFCPLSVPPLVTLPLTTTPLYFSSFSPHHFFPSLSIFSVQHGNSGSG